MSRRLWLTLLFTVGVLPAVAHAQSKPSFSGNWKLNLQESKLEDGSPIPFYKAFSQEIEHREPKLHILEAIDDEDGHRTTEWDLTTDGTERAAKVGEAPATVAAKWEGSQLLTRISWDQGARN